MQETFTCLWRLITPPVTYLQAPHVLCPQKMSGKSLEQDIIQCFGPPCVCISNNGPTFTSHMMKQYLKKYGIEHHPAPPYARQANGLVERASATLVNTLKEISLTTWDLSTCPVYCWQSTLWSGAPLDTFHFFSFTLLLAQSPKGTSDWCNNL